MKLLLMLAALATAPISGGARLVPQSKAAPEQSFEQRYPNLPQDAVARRARSNAVLEAQSVPVNKWLPVIESEAEVKQRAADKVLMRTLATLAVAVKAEGAERAEVDAIVRKFDLASALTPEERAFIADPVPSDKERYKFSWRFEAADALLWSLGLVDDLGPPREQCDTGPLVALLRDNSREQLLARVKLRPMSAILDQADLIYRYRWALVDAEVNGKGPPAGLSNDIAMERHHALNWLIGYQGQAWDDITLDT